MDKLNKKTINVSRGFTYTYYTSPAKDGLPTLFLAHGWPDTAELWSGLVIDYLVPNGYGIVAIDCLGYGGTSKPTDHKLYNFQYMTGDVVEILDAEKIGQVITTGHDWGCALSQRLYNFHANRCNGVIMLNVAYLAPNPDQPFDLDTVLKATEQAFGYGTFWYWKLFTAPDGAALLNDHLESVFTIAHGKPETWVDNWCTPDGYRKFLVANKTQPVEPYATDAMKSEFVTRMTRDKFDAPLCWYKSMTFGVQDEGDKHIPKENYIINVPTLFFGGTKDMVCRPEALGPSVEAGFLPHLKTVTVDAGHWAMLAKPKEFGEAVVGWLKENF